MTEPLRLQFSPSPNRPSSGLDGQLPARALFRLIGAAQVVCSGMLFLFQSLKAQDSPRSSEITLVSAPQLSPDGSRAVFEWCGDVWVGSSSGGEVTCLINHPAADTQPHFTPDGSRVVFQSDRSGKAQVYSVSVSGGEVLRHSFHGEGCELLGLRADGSAAIVRGLREYAIPRGWRLMEIDLKSDHRERRIFDAWAQSPDESPDGRTWLFVRNGEQIYRQGYRGSRAGQIWKFDRFSGRFHCEIAEETESLSPLWSADGGFFYVSARDGTHNLWKRNPDGSDAQLTHYQGPGVVMPAISADGSTLVFRQNNQVWRMRTNHDTKPELVLWLRHLPKPSPRAAPKFVSQVNDASYHPQSGWFAALGGHIWRKETPTATPKQVSSDPAFDFCVRVAHDGRHIAWLRDDGLCSSIVVAPVLKDRIGPETRLATMAGSAGTLAWFPNSTSLGWIAGLGDVWICGLDFSPARQVFSSWDRPLWDASPDGRWLVVSALDASANRDLWLVSTTGSSPPRNLTRHPGWESFPLWSPDGRSILFRSRRNRDSPTSLRWLRLSPTSLANHPFESESSHALADDATSLPIRGGSPTQVRWSHDGASVWYQGRDALKHRTRLLDLKNHKSKIAITDGGVPVALLDDGGLAWLCNGVPECAWPDGRRVRSPFEVHDPALTPDLLRWRFRQIWRALGERFYDPNLHGLDWNSVRLELEPIAAMAADSRQFDRIVNQLMGRLNASHLTFQREPWPGEKAKLPKEPSTAHPGWVFEDTSTPGPLKILRAIAGSPAAEFPGCPPNGPEGWIVRKIAGIPVDNRYPLHQIFREAENRAFPVVLEDLSGTTHTIELRCISYQEARKLTQLAELSAKSNHVAKQFPGGRYLRLRQMDRTSVDVLELQLHRAMPGASAVILDLRGNEGGREADRLLSWFHQPSHAVTQPRGGPEGYPADRLPHPVWSGPLVVLCDEHTFSNAEIFCHAIRVTGRAALVGRPTAGGVISAVMVRLPGIGRLQIPYRGWFRVKDRQNLDLHGATPNLEIDLTPADEYAQRDPQLDAAIQLLQQAK